MRYKYGLSILFALICSVSAMAQSTISGAPEQNCIGGIPVCRPIYRQTNAYIGCGSDSELNHTNYDCDPYNEEVNSVWYIIHVITPGTLIFKITPNRMTDDYDWSLWDITDSGCSSLYNYTTNTPLAYPSVRCNASGITGVTGLDVSATLPKEGPGGTPHFSTPLPVTAGQTYALCILNWSRSTYGYTLDFTESSASIYDTVRPAFKYIKVGECNYPNDTLHVTMTVPILCNTLDADGSDFYITPTVPGLTVNSAVSSICQTGGTMSTYYDLILSKNVPPGTYSLHVREGNDTNTLVDNCVNEQSPDDSIVFTVFKNFTHSDTTICGGATIQLNASVPNPDSVYTLTWVPSDGMTNIHIPDPTATPTNDVRYVATIKQILAGHTCVAYDTTDVTVLKWFQLFNKDTAICSGDPVQVRVRADSRYKYTWTPDKYLSDTTVTPVITTDTNMTYYLTAQYPGCKDSTSHFSISIIPVPDTFTLHANTLLCNGQSVQLMTPVDSTLHYMWNTGNATCCITVDQPGIYTLTKSTLCASTSDSIEIKSYPCDSCVWVPSAFTPNGDGRNDYFHPITRCPLKYFSMEVLNRYGQVVFQSYWIGRKWDGNVNGVPADVDTYYYLIKYTLDKAGAQQEIMKGSLTLIR